MTQEEEKINIKQNYDKLFEDFLIIGPDFNEL